MQRSIIQIANSTYLVSLPKQWISRYGIHKGEQVEVQDLGKTIAITTQKSTDSKAVELDVSGLDQSLKDILYALYKVGYHEVTLHYTDPLLPEKIQAVIQNEMIGFEIIEQRNSHCTIRSIAGVYEAEFDNIIRRTFLLLKSMATELVECMEQGNMTPIKNIKLQELNNNKYTAFCRRILHQKGYAELKKVIPTYLIVEHVEKVADEYKYLCDFFMDSKGKAIKNISPTIIALFKEANLYMEKCYQLYYKFDLKDMNEVFKFRKQFINKIHDVANQSARDARLAHYLVNIIQELTNIICFKLEEHV